MCHRRDPSMSLNSGSDVSKRLLLVFRSYQRRLVVKGRRYYFLSLHVKMKCRTHRRTAIYMYVPTSRLH